MLNLLVEGFRHAQETLNSWTTEVSQEILNEQAHLLIGHRDTEFPDLYGGITAKLSRYFKLPADVKPLSQLLRAPFGLT